MSRRRVQLVYTSSDDEDSPKQPHFENPNQPQPQHQQPNDKQDVVFHETMAENGGEEEEQIEFPTRTPILNIDFVNLNSSINTTTVTTTATTVSEPLSVEITDGYFIDVSENLSPTPPQVVTASSVSLDCPVNYYLRKMGLNLRREWLDSCKLRLQNTVPCFANLDVETKAKLCFGQFLYSDMNYIGAGVLPENVHQLHLVDLAGPFVLQVDEVINISCPLRERYKNAPPGLKRCLKLSMTDGIQRVFGMEYRPIKSLEALAPAGFKVVIRNVNVRRGLIMLVPEVLEILCGSVEELEEARERLVHEVNKPPRGKRTRSGHVPPLTSRATVAAWAQNSVRNDGTPLNDDNHVPVNNENLILHTATQFCENTFGARPISRTQQATSSGRFIAELPPPGRNNESLLSREYAQNHISNETPQPYISAEARMLPIEPLYGRESAEHSISRKTTQSSISVDIHKGPTSTEAPEHSPAIERTELNQLSATVMENEDAHMLDYMEHPFTLSGDKELPFTYLAILLAKWEALKGNESIVQGKIKCFLTGVKTFHFKDRSAFELWVYVDDGSLISEIFVHHNVVQKAIGYLPAEITAALSSPNKRVAGDMKNTLKQFQSLLINFEGTMLVEMNETSPSPVALEMNQGFPSSDARLLLQRLKPVCSRPLCQNGQSDVINLSP